MVNIPGIFYFYIQKSCLKVRFAAYISSMPFYNSSTGGSSSSGLDAAGAVAAVVAASPVNISIQGTSVRTAAIQSATSDVSTNGAAEPTVGQILTALGAGSASWQIAPSALQPNVVPNLLTAGMPSTGGWWVNLPRFGSGNMFELTNIGYVFGAYGGGSASSVAGGILFTSAALANQGCGWSQATSEVAIERRPWMRGRVKVSSTAADQGVWVGWVAGGGLSGVGGVTDNTLALSCETVTIANGGKQQTTWQVTSKATGAVDYVDTLVPYTADHDYELYMAISETNVVWAIYDHTSSTAYSGTCVSKANLPSSTTGLGVLYTGISGALGAALALTWGPCSRGYFGPV